MAIILSENKPDKIGSLYFYFDDFPYSKFLSDNEEDRFDELSASDHILDDKEFAELEQLAEKAIEIYNALTD